MKAIQAHVGSKFKTIAPNKKVIGFIGRIFYGVKKVASPKK